MICTKCGHDPDAVVFDKFMFIIDREPPSLNDRLFNAGPRARLYRKERDAWCWLFRAARLKWNIPIAHEQDRRRVTLTRLFGARQRERDHDNLVGGQKAVVDALVIEKLIAGDRLIDAEIYYGQKRSNLHIGLDVLIEVLK